MARSRMLITTAVGILCVLAALLFVNQGGNVGSANEYEAVFDNVTGLVNHSQVLYRGVQIGEVTRIDPADKGGHDARLTLTIDGEKVPPLQDDASMTLRLKSILGEMFMDLDPGSSGTPLQGKELPRTHRDTSLDRLLFAGAGLFDDLRTAEETKFVLDELRFLIDHSSDDLLSITSNTKELVQGLEMRLDTLSTIIVNIDELTAATAGRADEVGQAVLDVNQILFDVQRALVRNHEQITDLVTVIEDVVETADLPLLDEQLAQAPAYIDEVYQMTRLLHALAYHEIPILGSLVLMPNLSSDVYHQVNEIKHNPILRKIVIEMIETYYYSKPPYPGN